MIVEFSCKETEKVWNGERTRKWSNKIVKIALRKLFMIHAAYILDDLRIPPSNRLYALKGNLKDYYSISINMQWQIIFQWNDGQVKRIKITDYH
jgi:proteic killer suppression protein